MANLSGINTASGKNVACQVSLEGNDAEVGQRRYQGTNRCISHQQISRAHANQRLSQKYGVPSEFTAYICEQSNMEAVVGQLQRAYVAMPLARKPPGLPVLRMAPPQSFACFDYGVEMWEAMAENEGTMRRLAAWRWRNEPHLEIGVDFQQALLPLLQYHSPPAVS